MHAAAPTAAPDVAQLLARARRGDSSAWEQIVQRYTGVVMAVARAHRLDPQAAADVAQVTWLRLVEHLDSLRQPERLGAWLATTARRESLRTLRLRSREVGLDEQELDRRQAHSDAPEVGLLLEERDAELWRAMESLSQPCQRLLRLLIADPPLSYAEVAAALDRPIGSLGPTRQRCLDCLRRALGQ